ncbi:MAG: hypothetical protein V3U30_06055 [Thermoplasmata archaeon]
MKKPVSITLEEEILERIDTQRGIIPRSAWIEDLLKQAMRA